MGARTRKAVGCHAAALLTVLSGVLPVAPADAEPFAVPEIEWHGSPTCTPAEEVASKVRELLGTRSISGAKQDLRILGYVAEEAGGFRVHLVLTEGDRTRTRVLRAASCRELAAAAALVIALAIDPDRAEPSGTPDAAPSSTPPAAPQALPEPSPPPADVPTASVVSPPARSEPAPHGAARWKAFYALGPAFDFGVLPGAGLGGTLAGGAERGRVHLELASKLLGSRPARSPEAGAGGHLFLAAMQARLCVLPAVAPGVRVGPCPVVELGVLRGNGYGVEEPDVVTKPWGVGGMGLAGELSFGRWAGILAEADAGVPFGRPQFLLDGVPVHRPAAVVGSVRLLADVRFP